MADTNQWFGDDIQFSAGGDDLLADGVTEVNQRILRELLTNPGDYIWEPGYGVGIGQYIGKALSAEEFADIKARIRSVVLSQDDVQKQPEPAITFQVNTGGGLLSVSIKYIYAPTSQPQTLTYPQAN